MREEETYISIDSNNTGRYIEGFILRNQLIELHEYSENLNTKIKRIEAYVQKYKGNIIFSGGDNVMAKIPEDNIQAIVDLTRNLCEETIVFSIGTGRTAIDSYLALKYAKTFGGHFCIRYEDHQFKIQQDEDCKRYVMSG